MDIRYEEFSRETIQLGGKWFTKIQGFRFVDDDYENDWVQYLDYKPITAEMIKTVDLSRRPNCAPLQR